MLKCADETNPTKLMCNHGKDLVIESKTLKRAATDAGRNT